MKLELFKVKRGNEVLGDYTLPDIQELLVSGVLMPTDKYKGQLNETWLPLLLINKEVVRRTINKKSIKYSPLNDNLQKSIDDEVRSIEKFHRREKRLGNIIENKPTRTSRIDGGPIYFCTNCRSQFELDTNVTLWILKSGRWSCPHCHHREYKEIC